ncbi:unnamed protein product [Closterium sp. Naga37s-1]|nr:unnamed protein product [Closterium sp. Naga37s-1]
MADELATVKLFNDNTASVVYITNLATRKDAFTLDVMQVPQGTGSGFLWDTEGHVVTNFHVIRRATDLRVTLSDQSVYEATVVGADPNKDVAVLHIDAPPEKLRPLPVGSSSDLLVGQKVFAIGNPFGLDHTLTTGVISGLQREITSVTRRPIQDVIQTDAAINPGNSGGPLLDSSGTLIGINTAIYSPSGGSSGVGFAIPVDTVSGIVEQIIVYGQVTRPALNLAFAPEQLVDQLGNSGVLVLEVNPNGAAAKAGLRPTSRDSFGRLMLGDIITAIDGKPIYSGSDLYKILDKCQVGQTVDVQLLRGNEEVVVPVTLDGLSGKLETESGSTAHERGAPRAKWAALLGVVTLLGIAGLPNGSSDAFCAHFDPTSAPLTSHDAVLDSQCVSVRLSHSAPLPLSASLPAPPLAASRTAKSPTTIRSSAFVAVRLACLPPATLVDGAGAGGPGDSAGCDSGGRDSGGCDSGGCATNEVSRGGLNRAVRGRRATHTGKQLPFKPHVHFPLRNNGSSPHSAAPTRCASGGTASVGADAAMRQAMCDTPRDV